MSYALHKHFCLSVFSNSNVRSQALLPHLLHGCDERDSGCITSTVETGIVLGKWD